MERSKRFYAETLGLPSPNLDEGGWPEFETGNVSLYLMDPTNVGQEFEGPHTAHIALRVADAGPLLLLRIVSGDIDDLRHGSETSGRAGAYAECDEENGGQEDESFHRKGMAK